MEEVAKALRTMDYRMSYKTHNKTGFGYWHFQNG